MLPSREMRKVSAVSSSEQNEAAAIPESKGASSTLAAAVDRVIPCTVTDAGNSSDLTAIRAGMGSYMVQARPWWRNDSDDLAPACFDHTKY